MEKLTIKDIFKNKEKYLEKEVTVSGWIRQVKKSKKNMEI